VVEALGYKPEIRGFEARWSELIFFNLPNPSGRAMPWGFTIRNEYQKLKNNVSAAQSAAWSYGSQSYRHLWTDCLDNVGSLASQIPLGLNGLLRR
jgi:hypothetical protein